MILAQDKDIIEYQGRTKLLEFAIAISKTVNRKKIQPILKRAAKLRYLLKALDYSESLTSTQIENILQGVISVSEMNEFPAAPTLENRDRPAILVGGVVTEAASQDEVNAGEEVGKYVSPATLAGKALKNGTYSLELTFDTDQDIYQDVTTPTFTLASSGNINGVGIILRLNTPTSVTFPANFEELPSSSPLDNTMLNMYTLVYFSNWNGSGTPRVLYTNSLLTAV